jgi:hypothetical protein
VISRMLAGTLGVAAAPGFTAARGPVAGAGLDARSEL